MSFWEHWQSRPVHVKHHPDHKGYEATLYHPVGHPLFNWLRKAEEHHDPLPPGGIWRTLHPNGEDEPGVPVYLLPNHDGSYSVARGAGGKLNGLRLTGVKSDEEYKHLSAKKKEEQKNKEFQKKADEKARLGRQGYKDLQEARKERVEQAKTETHAQEEEMIRTAAEAVGIDPKTLNPDDHAKNVQKAREVVNRLKQVGASAFADVITEQLGEVSASDLAPKQKGDGIGYRTRVSDLAADHGLTEETKERVAEKLRQQGPAVSQPQPKEKPEEEPTPWDNSKLPTDDLSTIVKTVAAGVKVDAARRRQKEVRSEVERVEEAAQIPKAAVVVTKPMSDEEAEKAVLETLQQEAMQQAMTGLVEKTNELAGAGQRMREYHSIGANAAFNEVAQAVSGIDVDPLLSDTLGAQGTASVLAARWRQELSKEEFGTLREKLAQKHIQTQIGIASTATDKANSYLKEAEQLPSGEALDAMTLEEALAVHQRRAQLQDLAASEAGRAAGRLNAVAALNEAMMKGPEKGVLVSLGKVSPERAVEMAYSVGLTDPDEEATEESEGKSGNFAIHNDEGRMVLEVHPSGLAEVAGPVDRGVRDRAVRSAAIKRGDHDEPGWLPAGLSRRPRTEEREHPFEAARLDNTLSVESGDSADAIADKLKSYIGGRIHGGSDAFDAAADVAAASFQAGLSLSPEGQEHYQEALSKVIPRSSATGDREAYKAHREEARKTLEGYADTYVKGEQTAGRMTPEQAALDKQRIASDGVTRDALYVALHKDPLLAPAFKKYGDLGPEDRRRVRDYAFRDLFKLDRSDETPITPMDDRERKAYDTWKELEATGNPYTAIQAEWKKRSEREGGLFGAPETPPLAQVDLGDDTAVLGLARKSPALLGFTAVAMPDGSKEYPELKADATWTSYGPDGPEERQARSEKVIVQDARQRIRRALRAYSNEHLAGQPGIAESFNPEAVQTASDRWTEYCRDMGGERRAYATVQEFMRGDVVKKFAPVYEQRTGRKLHAVEQPIEHAEAHAGAMQPAEVREERRKKLAGETAGLRARKRGRFAEGGVKEQQELAKQQQAEGQSVLFGASEAAITTANVHRPTIGKAAEAAIAGMLPYVDTNRPVEVAGNITLDPVQQRATRLILENERQGVALGAGVGKTLTGIGAFTQARADGKATRALIMAPSNIVGQWGGEFAKFVDPDTGLRWHADPSASAEERRAAYGNPDIHANIVTAEAIREDVTRAVAEDLSKAEGKTVSPSETVGRLAAMDDAGRDALIHGALESRGWNWDFHLADEGHRMLERKGKPDSHMQRIGDSIARKARMYVYATADPAKNDASEIHSMLSKIDPKRYNGSNRAAFLRRYMRDTPAARNALRQEIAPYSYAAQRDFGVDLHSHIEKVEMPAAQRAEYDKVVAAYRVCRTANLAGQIDDKAIEALKILSPKTFESGMPSEEVLKRKLKSAGIMRDSALDRVVNRLPDGAKAQWAHDYLEAHRGEPTVIFSRNPGVLNALKKKAEKAGHRVAILTGEQTAEEKDRARLAFSPPAGEATADVMLCSDAGAVGGNLQRGYRMVSMDNPFTDMLVKQRIGRELRTGQQQDVIHHQLVADCGFDRTARKRLEKKEQLRELLTSPTEQQDDQDLGFAGAKALSDRFEQQYSLPAGETQEPVAKAVRLLIRRPIRTERKGVRVQVRRAA